MSEWLEYISEIIGNTASIFYGLRKFIKELAKELLLDGIYLDKINASVTRMEYVRLHAVGYDDDKDLLIVARWDRTYENISNPCRKQYELVDVEIEEI